MVCIIPIGRRRKRSSQFRIRFSCTMNSTMFSLMSRRSTNCYRFFNLITRTFFKWVYIRFYIHNLNRLISRCKDTFSL